MNPPKVRPTIINVRGVNGSGKSDVVFRLMDCYGAIPLLNTKGKIWAYQVHFEPEFYVLGNYTSVIGGCDMIPTMARVARGVRKLSEKGNVLFEGILVSLVTKPWIQLAHSLPDARFIFATLDTPEKVCIERRKKRKEGHGNPKNLSLKYRAIQAAHEKLRDAGMDVRRLSHEKPTHQIVNWWLEGVYGGEK